MRHNLINLSGALAILCINWTLPATAQRENPDPSRQVQQEQQVEQHREFTGDGSSASGTMGRASLSPKIGASVPTPNGAAAPRQLGARDGFGNHADAPPDGSGAGSSGRLGQGPDSPATRAACDGTGPGSATTDSAPEQNTAAIPSRARQLSGSSAVSCGARTLGSARPRSGGRGGRR